MLDVHITIKNIFIFNPAHLIDNSALIFCLLIFLKLTYIFFLTSNI